MSNSDVYAINLKDRHGNVVETIHSINDVPVLTHPIHYMGLWNYTEWYVPGQDFDPEQMYVEEPLWDIDGSEDINPRRWNRDYLEFIEHLTITERGKQVLAYGYEVIKNGEVVVLDLEESYIIEKVMHEYTRNQS